MAHANPLYPPIDDDEEEMLTLYQRLAARASDARIMLRNGRERIYRLRDEQMYQPMGDRRGYRSRTRGQSVCSFLASLCRCLCAFLCMWLLLVALAFLLIALAGVLGWIRAGYSPIGAPKINMSQLTEGERALLPEFLEFSHNHTWERTMRGDSPDDGTARLKTYAHNIREWSSLAASQNGSWSFDPHHPTAFADWRRDEMDDLVFGVPAPIHRNLTFDFNAYTKENGNDLFLVHSEFGPLHFEKFHWHELKAHLAEEGGFWAVWPLPYSAFGYQEGVLRPSEKECAEGKLVLLEIMSVQGANETTEVLGEEEEVLAVRPVFKPLNYFRYRNLIDDMKVLISSRACGDSLGSDALTAEFVYKMKHYYKMFPQLLSPRGHKQRV